MKILRVRLITLAICFIGIFAIFLYESNTNWFVGDISNNPCDVVEFGGPKIELSKIQQKLAESKNILAEQKNDLLNAKNEEERKKILESIDFFENEIPQIEACIKNRAQTNKDNKGDQNNKTENTKQSNNTSSLIDETIQRQLRDTNKKTIDCNNSQERIRNLENEIKNFAEGNGFTLLLALIQITGKEVSPDIFDGGIINLSQSESDQFAKIVQGHKDFINEIKSEIDKITAFCELESKIQALQNNSSLRNSFQVFLLLDQQGALLNESKQENFNNTVGHEIDKLITELENTNQNFSNISNATKDLTNICSTNNEDAHIQRHIDTQSQKNKLLQDFTDNLESAAQQINNGGISETTEEILINRIQSITPKFLNESLNAQQVSSFKKQIEARSQLMTTIHENFQNQKCNPQRAFDHRIQLIRKAHATNLPACPECNMLQASLVQAQNNQEILEDVITQLDTITNTLNTRTEQLLTSMNLFQQNVRENKNVVDSITILVNECKNNMSQLKQDQLCSDAKKGGRAITDARCDQNCNVDLIRINRIMIEKELTNIQKIANEFKTYINNDLLNEDSIAQFIHPIQESVEKIEKGYAFYTAHATEKQALTCLQNKINATVNGFCYGENKCNACHSIHEYLDMFTFEKRRYQIITADILTSFILLKTGLSETNRHHETFNIQQKKVENIIYNLIPTLIERKELRNIIQDQIHSCDKKVNQLTELQQCTTDGLQISL